MTRLLSACFVFFCVAPAARAELVTYALDPVHTRVLVGISHAGFSSALGTASGSVGVLRFDPDDWSTSTLDVRVPLARLDFGDAAWNRAVQAGNLLDVADHPEAHFVSTTVTALDPQRATVCGTLTLHGVTQPQCLAVTFNVRKRHPLPPFRQTVGFSATATLSRAAFGIDAWRSVIGDAVELRIEAEAIRDDDAMAPAAATPAPQVEGTSGVAPETEAETEAARESEPATEPEPTP